MAIMTRSVLAGMARRFRQMRRLTWLIRIAG
jgi:hypothetical protein